MAKTPPLVWIDAELALVEMDSMPPAERGRWFHEIMEKAACGDPIIPMPAWLRFDNPYESDDATR